MSQPSPSAEPEPDREDRHEFHVLVVEDEPHMARAVQAVLSPVYTVDTVSEGQAGLEHVARQPVALVLLDITLPDIDGLKVLKRLQEQAPDTAVVMLTGNTDVRVAAETIKLGARDYLQKPFDEQELLLAVERAYRYWELESRAQRLESELNDPYQFSRVIGSSPAIQEAIELARKLAPTDMNVLVTGESGTGKELFAHAIHAQSPKRAGPFVALNCSRYSGELLDSELFGHEQGAFTGAERLRRGAFEQAHTGTLLLDEIGTAPMEIQAKLLRAIETKEFLRVGGETPVLVDVRIVAATNVDLSRAVSENTFRQDLYYRLNVCCIDMPPLRDRTDDIPLLVDHFLNKHLAKTGRAFKGLAPEAMALLMTHQWPGNIRELGNLIVSSATLEDGDLITTRYFTPDILKTQTRPAGAEAMSLEQAVAAFEKQFLAAALAANDWNRTRTAKCLGVHRNTVLHKMTLYGIVRPQDPSQAGDGAN